MTNRPGPLERLLTAWSSRNLMDRRTLGPRIVETDVLRVAAAGMAGADVPLAMALFGLKYRAASPPTMDNLAPVVTGLGRMVRKQAKQQKWRIRRQQDSQRIVLIALHWWLMSVCPSCHGRQYEHIPGTPNLSDRQCHACHGQGKAPLHDVLRQQLGCDDRTAMAAPIEWLVGRMDRLETIAGDEYIRRLGRAAADLDDPWPY